MGIIISWLIAMWVCNNNSRCDMGFLVNGIMGIIIFYENNLIFNILVLWGNWIKSNPTIICPHRNQQWNWWLPVTKVLSDEMYLLDMYSVCLWFEVFLTVWAFSLCPSSHNREMLPNFSIMFISDSTLNIYTYSNIPPQHHLRKKSSADAEFLDGLPLQIGK